MSFLELYNEEIIESLASRVPNQIVFAKRSTAGSYGREFGTSPSARSRRRCSSCRPVRNGERLVPTG